jgi:hypothetical protein
MLKKGLRRRKREAGVAKGAQKAKLFFEEVPRGMGLLSPPVRLSDRIPVFTLDS